MALVFFEECNYNDFIFILSMFASSRKSQLCLMKISFRSH